MLRLLLITCIAFASGVTVAQDELPKVLSPSEVEAALRAAELVGTHLYQHDRAAAVATDALSKVRGFKKVRNLEGWITEARGDSITVTFVGREKDGSLAAYYRVPIDANGRVLGKASGLKIPEPLTEFETAAVRARELAVRSSFQPCAERYNSVVLPSGASQDEWVVYLLPGTTRQNIIPIGGSYRVEVDIRTGEADVRPYTRTCLQLQNDPGTAGFMVTQLLGSVPTEIHVYWSIWAQKPIHVVTPPHGTIWSVDGPKISLVKRGEEG